jgi:hypothetical protein
MDRGYEPVFIAANIEKPFCCPPDQRWESFAAIRQSLRISDVSPPGTNVRGRFGHPDVPAQIH